MIAASILSFVAVWLWVGGHRELSELGEKPVAAPRRPQRWTAIGAGAGVVAALTLGGVRLTLWVVIAIVVVGAAWLVARRRVERRRRSRASQEVTRAAVVMAGLLRAGMVPE